MKQVRRMTFETNSSSTHSITICPQETYKKWCDGKVLFGDWNNDFIEVEKLTPHDYAEARDKYESCKGKYYKSWDELSEEDREDYTRSYILTNKRKNGYDEYVTHDEWIERHNNGTETFTQYYTTASGDNIVAFGYYGYDG